MIQQRSSIGFRKIAPLLFVLVLMVSLFPFNALASDTLQLQANEADENSNNYTWAISDTGVLSIEAKSGTDGTLPSFEDTLAPWEYPEYRMQVTSVTVGSGVKANGSLAGMFSVCENMKSANLSQMDTTNATNMGNMFSGCQALQTVNLSGIKTANVIEMNGMFSGCKSLVSIDVSSFNTSKVESMMRMFNDCTSLTELNLSNFDTQNATDMSGMFAGCASLKTVIVGDAFWFKPKDGNGCTLPEGDWLSVKDNKVYTAAEIAANRNGVADTYVKDGVPNQEDDPEDSSGPKDPTDPAGPNDEPTEKGMIVYRLYDSSDGEHFYTANEKEREFLISLGWHNEEIGWIAPISGINVYRLYNPNNGDHFFTTNKAEYDYLSTIGWSPEGISWYSDNAHYAPIYRLFNPYATVGCHFWTASESERDWLITLGWQGEGVGWYALAE